MKRPILIEFSGLPNSGKTTLLHNMKKICESNNVNVTIVQEQAELFPKIIPKGSLEQNLWITFATLMKCLEYKFVSDVDFIFFDRGFYERIFWATMFENKDQQYSQEIIDFMKKFDKKYHVKPNYLFVVDVEIEESIRRRMQTGEPVTFSKKDFLVNYKSNYQKFIEKIDNKFYIDTTGLDEDTVAQSVFKTIVTL